MVSNNGFMAKAKMLQNVTAMSGEECRRLRVKAGFSQRELAELIGYSQASVCRWEVGEKNIPTRAAKLIAVVTTTQKAQIA